MPDYSFQNLTPIEFEELSRDLLQIHLEIFLESFTTGADGGVDFRCSYNLGNSIIVQCKRYSDFNKLLSNLKEEAKKVFKLSPKRYILVTTVGLTPKRKDKIFKVFNGYLNAYEDIIGRDDLNNLIGLYKEIEIKHFKLWLSSINVLESILHKKTINQSNFELEEIKKDVNIYVKNESFNLAHGILHKHNFLIISGIPGIGKTTLARILVYTLLGEGFNEFVYLSNSIDEGFERFNEGVSQVFLFDDFLGSNFLVDGLSRNEDQRIYKFIKRISESKNKKFILTTREHILSQSKEKYELFNWESFEIAKYIIDLAQYTFDVRARIFYNHLYFSNITNEYIDNLLESDSYLNIIKHQNYSPRILQVVTSWNYWKKIPYTEFSNQLIGFLDKPFYVWQHVYENQISKFSQYALAVLLSTDTIIRLDSFKECIKFFLKDNVLKYEIAFSEQEFRKSIRELENTFIVIVKDRKNNFGIRYKNPSVKDFLINYFKEYNNQILDILFSSIYFNQIFSIFEYKPNSYESPKIYIDEKYHYIIVNKLINNFDSLVSSKILDNPFDEHVFIEFYEERIFELEKICKIIESFNIDSYQELKLFLTNRFKDNLYDYTLYSQLDFEFYLFLVRYFNGTIKYNKRKIINYAFNFVDSIELLLIFEQFRDLFFLEFEEYFDDENNKDIIIGILESDINDFPEFVEYSIYSIGHIGENYNIDVEDLVYDLANKIEERQRQEDAEEDEKEEEVEDLMNYHAQYFEKFDSNEIEPIDQNNNETHKMNIVKNNDKYKDMFLTLKKNK